MSLLQLLALTEKKVELYSKQAESLVKEAEALKKKAMTTEAEIEVMELKIQINENPLIKYKCEDKDPYHGHNDYKAEFETEELALEYARSNGYLLVNKKRFGKMYYFKCHINNYRNSQSVINELDGMNVSTDKNIITYVLNDKLINK